ncbi:MAG: Cache 3/Cache 2 fusion domain-containing protein [Candidatus Riflebacteria bacterium]|nr:Cache 3/Cache 2 fusion domain-containing protein [Candidatus Riflebacteria bacterium]
MKILSIKSKLMIIGVGLVIFVAVVIGWLGYRELNVLGKEAIVLAEEGFEKSTLDVLHRGVEQSEKAVLQIIETWKTKTRELSFSPNLKDYLSSSSGKNKSVNELVGNEFRRILEGNMKTCDSQRQLLESTLIKNLQAAHYICYDLHGGFIETSATQAWEVTPPGKTEKVIYPLKVLAAKNEPARMIRKNSDPSISTPLIDEISKLTGVRSTIFHRLNEKGDMLRIGTSVISKEGKRAIGTVIFAQDENGVANTVIKNILDGKNFVGRAFVVDAWNATAYEPMYSDSGKVNGMLFVGIPEKDFQKSIVETVVNHSFGKTGKAFILDSKGGIIAKPDGVAEAENTSTLIPENIKSELLSKKADGKIDIIEYSKEGETRFVFFAYYQSWDWVICYDGKWTEMSENWINAYCRGIEGEMLEMTNNWKLKVDNVEKPMFSQIRLLNSEGDELIAIRDGKKSEKLAKLMNGSWYHSALESLKNGETYISRIQVADQSKRIELRIAVPIFDDEGKFIATVVTNTYWELIWDMLKSHVFGKTGYVYIVNDEGLLISHPKYKLTDSANIGDTKYGALADIVKNKMLKASSGVERYTFEGVDKYVDFRPLKIGSFSYSIAGNCPVEELFEIANQIKNTSKGIMRNSSKVLFGGGVFCLFIAIFLSLFITTDIISTLNSLNSEISRINDAVDKGELGIRGRTELIHFEFQPLLVGVNKTIDSIVKPLIMAADYVDHISKGDIPEKITDVYHGNFNTIKNNINLLVDSMNSITHTAQEIAEGNLSIKIKARSENDDLMKALASMAESLSKMIKEITSGVQTLATASTQLSSISEQMNAGTREVAVKATAVSSASEEMSINASTVAASMSQATTNLNSVAAATEEMSATIVEIAGKSDKAREVTNSAVSQASDVAGMMKALGKMAQEIGKFTETITSISAQTNMLALNATIEAARAGSAGKGFAVVANEIKELAKQAAAATEDIKTRIANIQSSTDGAIENIDKISDVIKDVSEVVTAIAAAMDEQSNTTKEVAKNIAQASTGVDDSNNRAAETSTVSKSIAKDISGVSAAASQLDSSSKQVNTSARDLSKLAEQLRSMVSKFRV